MSNLVEQYGSSWFMNKFNGCFFLHNEEPHIVQNNGTRWRTNVPCIKAEKGDEGYVGCETVVPADAFADVSVFSVPNLGWRSADKGRGLYYLARNNSSYYRGLSQRNVTATPSALTTWLQGYAGYNVAPNKEMLAHISLVPEFLSIPDGVAKIRAEEILSFAASPTIAVFPIGEDKMAVMFKQKRAGTIMPDDSMTLIIPELNSYMENL